MDELCRLDIQNWEDRKEIIGILTDSGYTVCEKEIAPKPLTLDHPTYEVVIYKKE